MKVYVLFGLGKYGEYNLIGVYESKDLAETRKSAIEGHIADIEKETGYHDDTSYYIKESQVNEEEP